MRFEPVIVRWWQRGVRHDWCSYVVLPQRIPPILSVVEQKRDDEPTK